MLVSPQFGVGSSLEQVFQLIHLSSNLFSSFEMQQEFASLKIRNLDNCSKQERKLLLRYFLDIIEFFSRERLSLVQDPLNDLCYSLVGFSGGSGLCTQ